MFPPRWSCTEEMSQARVLVSLGGGDGIWLHPGHVPQNEVLLVVLGK